jgi:chemotaxis family two-component system response regulator Rcp1
MNRPPSVRVLLVEDTPSDAWLIKEAFRVSQFPAHVISMRDGVEAIEYLRNAEKGAADWPDLILLDLNLPKKNGHEVLADIKASPTLRSIPVVMLTSSDAEDDMRYSYALHASCFLTKPSSLPAYVDLVRGMEKFWLGGIQLRRTA